MKQVAAILIYLFNPVLSFACIILAIFKYKKNNSPLGTASMFLLFMTSLANPSKFAENFTDTGKFLYAYGLFSLFIWAAFLSWYV